MFDTKDINQNKIKIACVIHSLSIGGMERVMSVLLNEFAVMTSVEVHLLLIGKKREVHFDLHPAIHIHKPEFEFTDYSRSISTLKTIPFIRRTIQELEPNAILSFGEYWNNLVLLSLYGLPYPVYVSDRSQPNKNLGRIQNRLRNWLYPKAKGYIAQTNKAMEIAKQKNWNSNIKVIGNPIRCIPEAANQVKENWVVTVGRLIKTKHIDELITIFARINQPDWKLIIVGGNAKKGILLKEYEELISKLQMQDKIFLKGSQSDVAPFYQKSKLFAFTSSSEGFPNVIGEAVSAKLPVIAYDCVAGPSDLIQDEITGYLIPERNEQLYVTRLKQLMENESLRAKMSANTDSIRLQFDASVIAAQFFQFITQTTTVKKKPPL